MKFRNVQRLAIDSSTLKPNVQFINRNASLGHNTTQFESALCVNIPPQPMTEVFNFSDYNFLSSYVDVQVNPWIFQQVNYDISLGMPLIFSISPNAEELLLKGPTLKENVLDMLGSIADFMSEKDLKAIGEISIFQEDESEPKLFITYGILNKRYDEILKLWDEACKELMKSIPLESLEKVAIIFDQL